MRVLRFLPGGFCVAVGGLTIVLMLLVAVSPGDPNELWGALACVGLFAAPLLLIGVLLLRWALRASLAAAGHPSARQEIAGPPGSRVFVEPRKEEDDITRFTLAAWGLHFGGVGVVAVVLLIGYRLEGHFRRDSWSPWLSVAALVAFYAAGRRVMTALGVRYYNDLPPT